MLWSELKSLLRLLYYQPIPFEFHRGKKYARDFTSTKSVNKDCEEEKAHEKRAAIRCYLRTNTQLLVLIIIAQDKKYGRL